MDIAFIGFLAMCSFLHRGFSLSCYECNSNHNETCRNPPDSAKKECKSDKPICRVIHMEVNTQIEGMTPHSRVVRTCGEMDQKDETRPCYRISEYGVHQHVCSCTEDNCNLSSMPAATTVLFVLTALFLILFN